MTCLFMSVKIELERVIFRDLNLPNPTSCNTSPASSTTSSTVSSISVKQEPNNNVSQNVANFLTIKTELPDPHFNDSQNTTNFKVSNNSYQICLNLISCLVKKFSQNKKLLVLPNVHESRHFILELRPFLELCGATYFLDSHSYRRYLTR